MKQKIQFVKVTEDLWLAAQNQTDAPVKKVDVKMHHTFIIDCSYSMYEELPDIQVDLGNKLAAVLKDGDSFSLIWFSGRNQCGIILEDYQVDGPMDLETARTMLRRYLKPVGLTAFVEPLREIKSLMERVSTKRPEYAHSMFFMTDGHDNQWSSGEILRASAELKELLSIATMVEYGWYCNKKLMSDMAAELGGAHIFSEQLKDLEVSMNNQLLQRSGKRRAVALGHAVSGWAFTIKDGKVCLHKPEDNEVMLPEDDENLLFFLTDRSPDECSCEHNVIDAPANELLESLLDGVYASAVVASKAMDNVSLHKIMAYLGDVEYIERCANAFGVQKITEFESAMERAISDADLRFVKDYDPSMVPDPDAYCFIDMLNDLMSDPENKWYPLHEAFQYKRIGKKMVTVGSGLTETDKKKLDAARNTGDINEIKKVTDEIANGKQEEFDFIYDEENPWSGFEHLTWNAKRANLSVRVEYRGRLKLPADRPKGLPGEFPTMIYRNYSIVKDGIIHTYRLPVSLTEDTFRKLQSRGLLEGETWAEGQIYVLDFSSLPVININMAKTKPSAKSLGEKSLELLKLQAQNKVLNWLRKQNDVDRYTDYADVYGADAALWLKTQGIMPYGYSPKKQADKTGEEISVPALEVKIKGMSLPQKVDAVLRKVNDGEDLNEREKLYEETLKAWLKFRETLSDTADNAERVENWLRSRSNLVDMQRRELMRDVSVIKFLIIVGRQWFEEFDSRADKSIDLPINESSNVTIDFVDKEEVVKL